ncbi:MAG: type II secretion system protein [Campylobacter sp.]|nr:type II secretion system protein [Campylobacter sp.]
MNKNGFTLLELIFVIVVFGIISMFGADLYTKIYNSYAHTRAVNQLEARTMNAITIISSRLEDRIKGTVIARRSSDNTFVDIRSASQTHDIIEWIGQSVESKNLVMPTGGDPADSVGWSGFADIYNMATPIPANFNFISQGSHFNGVGTVIRSLRGNADASFGIIFKGRIAVDDVENAYGYELSDFNNTFIGTANGRNNETVNINYPVRAAIDEPGISEQYYLAHSAYAIVPTNHTEPYLGPSGNEVAEWNFDLALHYNYEPWSREAYNGANVSTAIMVRDVSLFRFRNDDGAIALKLCLRDAGRNFNPEELDLIVCKSQVVY